jgi:hypothetical protein
LLNGEREEEGGGRENRTNAVEGNEREEAE